MFLTSSCRYLCPIHWSQVLSREWRCSWSSADRQCSNYIWVINKIIAYQGATYIRDLTVTVQNMAPHFTDHIFNLIFLHENFIFIQMLLRFVHKDPKYNKPALVWIMARCQTGSKPLSEPIMTELSYTYMTHSAFIKFDVFLYQYSNIRMIFLLEIWSVSMQNWKTL